MRKAKALAPACGLLRKAEKQSPSYETILFDKKSYRWEVDHKA